VPCVACIVCVLRVCCVCVCCAAKAWRGVSDHAVRGMLAVVCVMAGSCAGASALRARAHSTTHSERMPRTSAASEWHSASM
jgi:hypothetical protein